MMNEFTGILYFHFHKIAHITIDIFFPSLWWPIATTSNRENRAQFGASSVKKSPRAWWLSLGASVTIVARDTINKIHSKRLISVIKSIYLRVLEIQGHRETIIVTAFAQLRFYLIYLRFILIYQPRDKNEIQSGMIIDFWEEAMVICSIGKYFLALTSRYRNLK